VRLVPVPEHALEFRQIGYLVASKEELEFDSRLAFIEVREFFPRGGLITLSVEKCDISDQQ
jgi:hypothetical protein